VKYKAELVPLDSYQAIEAAAREGDFAEVTELLLGARDRSDYQQIIIRALAKAVRFGKEFESRPHRGDSSIHSRNSCHLH
jgi:hypothetical protein